MSTINELLDAAKATTGSDYKTAQVLGITRQRLYAWRKGDQNPQPEDHALVAQIAGRDPMAAMARAVLEKHGDSPKGERLRSALGKSLQAIGGLVITLGFASGAFLSTDARAQGRPGPVEACTTMYRKVKWAVAQWRGKTRHRTLTAS